MCEFTQLTHNITMIIIHNLGTIEL